MANGEHTAYGLGKGADSRLQDETVAGLCSWLEDEDIILEWIYNQVHAGCSLSKVRS